MSVSQHASKDNSVWKCFDAAPSFKSVIPTQNMFFVICFCRDSILHSFLYQFIACLWVVKPWPIKQRWSMHEFFCLYQYWFFPVISFLVWSLVKKIPVASVPGEDEFKMRCARNGVSIEMWCFDISCNLKHGLQLNTPHSGNSFILFIYLFILYLKLTCI